LWTLVFIITLAVFYSPLFYAWHYYPWPKLLHIVHAYISIYATMGSYLPYSDAAGYYAGAQTLLHHGVLTTWASRRPLNAMFLVTRLFWLGNNLKAALLFQSVLCAACVFLASLSIKKIIGNIAALFFLVASFAYIAIFLPTVLSTPLGFFLGALALVLLLEATHYKNIVNFCAGGFVLTIALFARAGAFFVLPFLALWCGFYFKNASDRFSWKSSFAFCCSAIGAYLVNALLIKTFSPPHAALMGNFSSTLYGLVTGKGWSYTHIAFSHVKGLSTIAYDHMVYYQSFKTFLHQPLMLFKTLFQNTYDFLRLGFFSKINFIYFILLLVGFILSFRSYRNRKKQFIRSPQCISVIVLLAWTFLALALGRLQFITLGQAEGALGCFITVHCAIYLFYLSKNKLPIAGMLLYSLIGVIASSSILWADGGRRVFSSTMPLYIAAFAVVLYYLFFPKKVAEHMVLAKNPVGKPYLLSRVSLTIVLVLLFTTIATSTYLKFSRPPLGHSMTSASAPKLCPEDEDTIVVNNSPEYPSMIIAAQHKNKWDGIDARHFIRLLSLGGIEKPARSVLTRQANRVIDTQKPIEIKMIYAGTIALYFVAPPDYFKKTGKLYFCKKTYFAYPANKKSG